MFREAVMKRKVFWIKALVLTNLVSLIFLAIISFHYEVPKKVLIKMGIIENNDIPIKYDMRNSLFSVYQNMENGIVMLGDSITAGVEWNELLGMPNIANRGIGSDTTEGFCKRLENIYKIKPEICFIMGGINDIGYGIPVEKILENIGIIIEGLSKNGIKPVIQSALYVSAKADNWKKTNNNVDKLNSGLKNICVKKDITFVDINGTVSANGSLAEEYTYDGVHLNGSGYNEWKKLIKPIIGTK
jgi:lysophospholipase L1-like esterase